MGSADERWAAALQAWAIPEAILDAAPESPWGFDVGLFARIADHATALDGMSRRRALEALPRGGSVLDVGCGAGAGSVPLVPPAARLVGIDETPGMLAEFARRAEEAGAEHAEITGRWPDVADAAPVADLVVCHNVFYNVADLVPFVRALTGHARRRVVAELTAAHPLTWMNPYWRALHGLDRPEGPTAADAAAVVREAGFDVRVELWDKPATWEHRGEELVAFVRKRLCLPAERDDDIRALAARHQPPQMRRVATLWWEAAAAG